MKSILKNKKIFNKKNIFILTTAASIASVPLIVGTFHIQYNNNSILANNQNFSNVNSTMEYIKNNHKSYVRKIENKGTEWSIDYMGQTHKFDDPKKIESFINKNIMEPSKETWVSSIANISKYTGAMGEVDIDKLINNKEISLFEKEKNINPNNLIKDIYKGNNDKGYSSEQEAKNSFLSTGQAYFFNDIFFTNKEDLKSYLLNEYLPNNNTSFNTIVLKGPNGKVSSPINITSKTASLEIERFIRNNAEKTLDYTNSNTGEITNINFNNLESNLGKVNLTDLNYLHVQSNQGESRYVVDNADGNNLIGPYFYQGNIDSGSFMNKKMWRKVNGINKKVYVESKVDTMIGSFFTSILNDDAGLILRESSSEKRIPGLFRTPLVKVNPNAIVDGKTGELVDEVLNMDDWFLVELKNLSPELFYEVTTHHVSLLLGNKYNTFYKLPILYNFLLSRIVNWGLGQDVLDLVNYYFSQVTDFIQDVLEVLFDDETIFEKKVGDQIIKFDTTKLFQIGNPEYDFNTSIEYFLNEIKTYDKLMAAIWAYNSAFTNLFLTGGMIPFESNDPSFLFENNTITETDFNNSIATLKKIYNIFSQTEYVPMVEMYISNSKTPKIVEISKLNKSLWIQEFDKLGANNTGVLYSIIIKSIGMKNNEYSAMASGFIKEEINIFKESGKILKNGYLQQLYNKDSRKNSLDNYVIYMDANPTQDYYKTYLAFLFSHRLKRQDFMGDNVYTDPTSFGIAVARLIGFAFGTAALVGSTINTVRFNNKNVSNNDHTFIEMVNDQVDGKWESEARTIRNNDDETIAYSLNAYSKDVNTKINVKRKTEDQFIVFKNKFEDDNNAEKLEIAKIKFEGNSNSRTISQIVSGVKKIRLSDLSDYQLGFVISFNNPWFTGFEEAFTRHNLTDAEFTKYFSKWVKTNHSGLSDPVGIRPLDFEDFGKKLKTDERFSDIMKDIMSPTMTSIGHESYWPSDDYPMKLGGDKITQYINDLHDPDFIFDDSPSDVVFPGGGNDNNNGSNRPGDVVDGAGPGASNKDGLNKHQFSNEAKQKQKSYWKNGVKGLDKPNINFKSIKNSGITAFNKVKDAFNVAVDILGSYVLPVIGSALMVLEIVTMMLELFQKQQIQDFYVYTTADGTEFIWDGGLTVAEYLGFKVTQVSGIESMILIKPTQITLGSTEEYYYFDKIKYYDVRDMKKAILTSMLETGNTWSNTQFSVKYSLTSSNQIVDGKNTLDELISYIYEQMGIVKNKDGSLDITNINKNSNYISNVSYAFNSGLITTDESKYVAITNNILENIRKTNIIQLPKVDVNNKAVSNSEFKLSGKVYQNKKVETIDSEYEYIIENSANLLKEGVKQEIGNYRKDDFIIANIKDAEADSYNKALLEFNTNVNIDKKSGILKDISIKKYSEISSSITKLDLYKININPLIGPIIFSSYEDAKRYILSQLNFQKHATYTEINVYDYNGKIIYGDNNLKKFTESLISQNHNFF